MNEIEYGRLRIFRLEQNKYPPAKVRKSNRNPRKTIKISVSFIFPPTTMANWFPSQNLQVNSTKTLLGDTNGTVNNFYLFLFARKSAENLEQKRPCPFTSKGCGKLVSGECRKIKQVPTRRDIHLMYDFCVKTGSFFWDSRIIRHFGHLFSIFYGR